MSAADIYNFEGVFEPPIAKLFSPALIAFTSLGRLNDDGTISAPDFQKDRPRVEVSFSRGAGAKRWHLPDDADVNPNIPKVMQSRESAWSGNLTIALVTAADAGVHLGLLPTVRSICATLPGALDGIKIQNHCINGPLSDVGETHQYNTDKGYYATIIHYIFAFSVQNTAWALLNQP